MGVHRAVEQQDARKFSVAGHGKSGRNVGLGTQLVVEVQIDEQPLFVGRLAMFEVDLPGDGLVSGRHGGDPFGYLDRVEPHARRVAQTIGGAQAPHDRTVLVENLGIGSGQPQHLDLPGAGNGVAVTDGHRSRILERLGQVAAGHLAKTRKGDHLALDDAVALDEVAA